MTDPVFLTAVAGLGLSVIVSGIRLSNWFLQSDPKALAQAGRWSALAFFALSLPLLLGLAINQRWVEAIGLSAVLLLGFALYGQRVLGQLFPRRLVPDFGSPSAAHHESEGAGPEADLVRRSIAVLEDYLRRTAGIAAPDGAYLNGNRSQISHARAHRNGGSHNAGGQNRELRGDQPSMSEAEALEVLGIGLGATETDIAESHRRLMQLIHPDRGGSPYFAVKVNQAKDVLLNRIRPESDSSAGARPRKHRRRDRDRPDLSEPRSTTGG